MKLIKTKEIAITPLLFGIIFSVLISNSIINNQQAIAQQQSPEEIQNEILRGNVDIGGDGTPPQQQKRVQFNFFRMVAF